MKKPIFLFAFYIVISSSVTAQIRLSCDSLKNAFVNSNELYTIKPLGDTVYSYGKIYYDRDSISLFSELLPYLNLDSNITFKQYKIIPNRIDSSEIFIKFQQLYKDIPVDGGGYTENYFISTDGPSTLCLEGYSVLPYILTGIDLDPTDAKNVSEISTTLGITPIDSSELFIGLNHQLGCEYSFYYHITYYDSNLVVTDIVDARSSLIVGRNDNYHATNPATTYSYGQKNMNDSNKDASNFWLVTENGVLHTYDMELEPYHGPISNDLIMGVLPSSQKIPTLLANSNPLEWPAGKETSYQSHWITEGMIDLWHSDFNASFQEVHVLTRTILNNAFSMPYNTLEKANFVIGDLEDFGGAENYFSFGFPNEIAHELTHAVLHDVGLGYTSVGLYENKHYLPNATLHEGIADFFSIYFRSKFLNEDLVWIYGQTDWEMSSSRRDFSDPTYKCVTQVEDFTIYGPHVRSDPMRYWFYNCVEGDEALKIPAIDIKTVLDIVLIAASEIDPKSGFNELMRETLDQTIRIYGRCSDEFLSLARSWENICVPTGFVDPITDEIPQCDFSIDAPLYVYEEDNYLYATLDNYSTSINYVWTLIGQKNTDYESTFGMTGSGQYGGFGLELIQFPTHNYYPQKLTIKVYSPTLGSQYIAKRSVQILDKDGDDPTCQEYYSNFVSSEYNGFADENSFSGELSPIHNDVYLSSTSRNANYKFSNVYTYNGQLIYSGNINELNYASMSY